MTPEQYLLRRDPNLFYLLSYLLHGNGLRVESRVARLISGRRRPKGGSDIRGEHVHPEPPILYIYNSVVSFHLFGVFVRYDFADWFYFGVSS
jgi:hypothetical protein